MTHHTRQSLTDNLTKAGIAAGDVVMIHVSLRSVGTIVGGADVLVDALRDIVSPGGALMMYTGCEKPFDSIGRSKFSPADEQFFLLHCPAFDPAKARANRNHGAMAEIFRTHAGVVHSDHVSWRFAAIGDKAPWLMANHPLQFGADRDSPMAKLVEVRGKVLLIGSDPDRVTLLHHAEGLANIDDRRTVRIQVPLLKNGERVWTEIVEHDSSNGVCPWPDQFFADIVSSYVRDCGTASTKVGDADVLCLDAKRLVEYAKMRMECRA